MTPEPPPRLGPPLVVVPAWSLGVRCVCTHLSCSATCELCFTLPPFLVCPASPDDPD